MSRGKAGKDILVSRITIDEKLSDDTIRIMTCNLNKGKKYFNDSPRYWSSEEEEHMNPDDYVEKLGLTSSQAKNYEWEDFKEGQVYFSGYFKLNQNKKKPYRFVLNKDRKQFLRIDEKVKDDVKQLYFRALSGVRR